jgi:uncharacterized membrane protein
MDAGTASIIAAIIAAVASNAVALITTIIRNDDRPPMPSSQADGDDRRPVRTSAAATNAVRFLHVLGWFLVVFLYLFGALLMAFAFAVRNDPSLAAPVAVRLAPFSKDTVIGVIDTLLIALILGELCIVVALWGTKRLWR